MLQYVILSAAKNLVGGGMEIVTHRFFTPLRFVQNDKMETRDSHVATALLLGMTNYNAPHCHSEECEARRGSLDAAQDRGLIVHNQILR